MNWTRTTFACSQRLVLLLVIAVVSVLGSSCRRKEIPKEVPTVTAPNDGPVSDGILEGLQKELATARTLNVDTAERVKFLRPVLKCVEPISATQWRAHFGYANTSNHEIVIPVSLFNRFWPPPLERSQPTAFGPGSKDDVARVAFNPLGATAWVLGSDFAMANSHSPTCPPKR